MRSYISPMIQSRNNLWSFGEINFLAPFVYQRPNKCRCKEDVIFWLNKIVEEMDTIKAGVVCVGEETLAGNRKFLELL